MHATQGAREVSIALQIHQFLTVPLDESETSKDVRLTVIELHACSWLKMAWLTSRISA